MAENMLDELRRYVPIGSDITLVVKKYGAPTRVLSGRRAISLTPVDALGKELFEIDEVYVWEFEDRNSLVDALTFRGTVVSYQVSLLRPLHD